MRLLHRIALVALVAGLPSWAAAGGIAISEYGSRTSGLAGTAAAVTDPASVFYNPGNVALDKGLHAQLGISGLFPKWSFTPAGSDNEETSLNRTSTPPNLTATYNLGQIGPGDLAFGFGFYVPYGSTFAWPKSWTGRSEVQALELQIFELTPVVAYRPHKMVSLGVGFRYMPGAVYLKRAVQFGDQAEGKVELGGSGDAFGASAGVTVLPIDKLAVGFSWRSASTIKIEGDSDFTFPEPFTTQGADSAVETELALPQVFRLGAAYDVLPELKIAADVEHQIWTPFRELAITFIDEEGVESTQVSERQAENSWVVRFAGEYEVSEAVKVRAGYAFDEKTLPERTVNPTPPDSHRHLITVGGSYAFDRYAVHAYAGNAFFTQRETRRADLEGTYEGGWPLNTMAYLLGVTFSAAFDFGAEAAPAGEPAAEPAPEPVTTTETPSASEAGVQP